MSLTPANTAEMGMNSASKVCAINRASVVLPVPGGPHRIIECGFPDSNASRNGLPGPSRCAWPTTSSRRCGRSTSASGAAGSRCLNKSFTDDVRPLGRHESECVRRKFRIAFERGEFNYSGLTELVVQLHRLQPVCTKAEPHALKRIFLCFRHRLDPVQI